MGHNIVRCAYSQKQESRIYPVDKIIYGFIGFEDDGPIHRIDACKNSALKHDTRFNQ